MTREVHIHIRRDGVTADAVRAAPPVHVRDRLALRFDAHFGNRAVIGVGDDATEALLLELGLRYVRDAEWSTKTPPNRRAYDGEGTLLDPIAAAWAPGITMLVVAVHEAQTRAGWKPRFLSDRTTYALTLEAPFDATVRRRLFYELRARFGDRIHMDGAPLPRWIRPWTLADAGRFVALGALSIAAGLFLVHRAVSRGRPPLQGWILMSIGVLSALFAAHAHRYDSPPPEG